VVFDSGYATMRVAVAALFAYGWLLLVLRITGKRTLAKMNAFDLVVTVALGSTLATVALSSDVTLTEGATALAVLCGAQFAVAWTSTRSELVRRTIKATPVVVLRDGELLTDVLRSERLTEGEVRQAIRQSGRGEVTEVAAVVLETDGNLSVIAVGDLGSGSALQGVLGGTGSRRPSGTRS
jgi:uncharacterized membrane protein YcaP (DUF421 family)